MWDGRCCLEDGQECIIVWVRVQLRSGYVVYERLGGGVVLKSDSSDVVVLGAATGYFLEDVADGH